ncbi:nucleolar DEAD-box protein required for synthesis of 60S ribosomal subunit [Emydomyces testavorans]|uniref:RNA helicase n=1 Tax=Emydomyces testavorans TaxID=2070801 RepID=A0AAF0IHH9_9EURO|nr:nucleolar DEAD-box protein required for synthesis of 60S ribosomal subunit [Emydomyces testavorans]
MGKRKASDDEFILTLSDEDAPYADGNAPEEEGDDDLVDINQSESAKARKATAQSSKKRRREDSDARTKNKKLKKQGQGELKGKKRGKVAANGQSAEYDDVESGEEAEEEEEEEEEEEGIVDPDFEFDIGGATSLGLVEEFDGWGAEDRDKKKVAGGAKKGVDLDEILFRRRQEKLEGQNKKRKGDVESDAGNGFEGLSDGRDGHDESDGSELPNFEDDELLAPDAFGMGAASESDGGCEKSAEEESEDESMPEMDEPEDGDVSDDVSIASPVPHPDDLQSEEGSESEEEDPDEAAKRKAFFAPEEKSSTSKEASSDATFQNFNLSRPIIRGLAAVGFTVPTPIQQKAIPVGLLGKDLVGGAVTGSGKTAAFVIPILERLLYRPRKVPTSRVAILMPTRELAVQCYNVATKLATFTDITFCQLVGGFSLREQENVLKQRPDVIIATPGRFIDHMRNSASFTVDTLEILVLDEADRMLEDGFADELNEILATIPKSRQTMLFSATMTDSVDKLIRVGLNKPVRLMVDAKKQTVGTLVQEFVRLRPGREGKRMGYLVLLCSTVYTNCVIVFFRQKKEAHRARIVFGLLGLKAAELHGSMSQEQRIQAVEAFRDGRVSFLLATDLASRGLDIKGVETVINYEAPQSHEIYLHRVGRTARAGRSGRACTIAAEPDRKIVKAAVKAGRAQGAKIVSRVVEPTVADEWATRVDEMQSEVEEVLQEETQEKQLAQAEMQATRGQNLIQHESEIMSRPKRTWFETEREKQQAKHRGLTELNGPGSSPKKQKRKLSGKEKKKLDDTRLREGGKIWKKGKKEREAKGTKQGTSKGKAKKNKNKGRTRRAGK